MSSFCKKCLIFSFIAAIYAAAKSTEPKDLELVQLITISRHGTITPEIVSPLDPHKEVWLRMGEPESLTSVGAQEHINLGVFLRNRYGHFLTTQLAKNATKAYSTEKSRAKIASLNTIASILEHENLDENWLDSCSGGTWSSICEIYPVDNSATFMHKSDWVKCKKLVQLNKDLFFPAKIEDYESNKEFYAELSEEVGQNLTSFEIAKSVFESVVSAQQHKLEPSMWIKESSFDFLHKLYLRDYGFAAKTNAQVRLSGGPTLGVLMKALQSNLKKETKNKTVMLFGHTSSFMAIKRALGLSLDFLPDFGATLMMEVWKDKNGRERWMRLFYKHSTNEDSELQEVWLPGCKEGVPCPIKTAMKIIQRMAVHNYQQECSL